MTAADDPSSASRWAALADRPDGEAYQQRFDLAAARGEDVHGEAGMVAGLLAGPSRVLDAGCGTGRVAARLTALGHRCVGVDADRSMIETARRRDPDTAYLLGDLVGLALDGPPFDLVVAAGNVVPLLAPGALPTVVARLVAHLRPDGLLVAGFGLDADHLPPGCPVTTVTAYDAVCSAVGLTGVERHSTWSRDPWRGEDGYVVTVHRRSDPVTP